MQTKKMNLGRYGHNARDAMEVIDVFPAGQAAERGEALYASVMDDAMLMAAQDRRQALMAKAALENAGGLSLMATRLSSVAPLGDEMYQAIVATYVRKAIQRIERS